MSQPTRAAWIEIVIRSCSTLSATSQLTRAAWIEIIKELRAKRNLTSQPTRAAWIEMATEAKFTYGQAVAAHSGCVD